MHIKNSTSHLYYIVFSWWNRSPSCQRYPKTCASKGKLSNHTPSCETLGQKFFFFLFVTLFVGMLNVSLYPPERGVYGNAIGYPGGVTLAILTAHICQRYPNATPSVLLNRFFRLYSAWKWTSSQAAIVLGPVEDKHLGFTVWDPNVILRALLFF